MNTSKSCNRRRQATKNTEKTSRDCLAFTLNPRHPPISLNDLATMLEIDLLLGRRRDFLKRLRAALHAQRIMAQGNPELHPRAAKEQQKWRVTVFQKQRPPSRLPS